MIIHIYFRTPFEQKFFTRQSLGKIANLLKWGSRATIYARTISSSQGVFGIDARIVFRNAPLIWNATINFNGHTAVSPEYYWQLMPAASACLSSSPQSSLPELTSAPIILTLHFLQFLQLVIPEKAMSDKTAAKINCFMLFICCFKD